MNFLIGFLIFIVGAVFAIFILSLCQVNKYSLLVELIYEARDRALDGDEKFIDILNEYYGKNNW